MIFSSITGSHLSIRCSISFSSFSRIESGMFQRLLAAWVMSWTSDREIGQWSAGLPAVTMPLLRVTPGLVSIAIGRERWQ